MSPIPRTIHGLCPFECMSAMQKCIRRGLEREAMEFACELGHTTKGFATIVTNRLQVISHEDVGIGDPAIIPLVRACCEQARQFYSPKDVGNWRMMIGSAIRAMARAPKSREGDHFHAAVGLRHQLLDKVPEIPDWALDAHTARGRKLGRGLDYFRAESTRLEPAPEQPDPYEAEAYEMWKVRDGRKGAEAGPEAQETLF